MADLESPQRHETGDLRHETGTEVTEPTLPALELVCPEDEVEGLCDDLYYRKRFLAFSERGPAPVCGWENSSPNVESSPIGQALVDRKRRAQRRAKASPQASPKRCGSVHVRGGLIIRRDFELNP